MYTIMPAFGEIVNVPLPSPGCGWPLGGGLIVQPGGLGLPLWGTETVRATRDRLEQAMRPFDVDYYVFHGHFCPCRGPQGVLHLYTKQGLESGCDGVRKSW